MAVFYSFSSLEKVNIQEEKTCIKLCTLHRATSPAHDEKVLKEKTPEKKKIEPLTKAKIEIKKITPQQKKVEIKDAPKYKEEKIEAKETLSETTLEVFEQNDISTKDDNSPSTNAAHDIKNVPQHEPEIKEEDEYLKEHIAIITKLLQDNLYYPRSARKRAIEGNVVVKFKLLPNASVAYITVLKSPSEVLSRGAIQTIENISSKFPKPKKELILEVPISYKLN